MSSIHEDTSSSLSSSERRVQKGIKRLCFPDLVTYNKNKMAQQPSRTRQNVIMAHETFRQPKLIERVQPWIDAVIIESKYSPSDVDPQLLSELIIFDRAFNQYKRAYRLWYATQQHKPLPITITIPTK